MDANNPQLPPDRPLTEAERYPLLTDRGRRLLHRMNEHAAAPAFNHICGDRLDEHGLAEVRNFAEALQTARAAAPEWLDRFLERVIASSPFYTTRAPAGASGLRDIPTCNRADLASHLPGFVPLDAPLEELIVHSTSGRTGRPIDLPHHPIACSQYLPIFQTALAEAGIEFHGKPETVAIALVGAQRRCLSCATVSIWLNEAGYIKINLHGDDWRTPDDPACYLNACRPEVITGDPIAFESLMQQPLEFRPKAMLSTAMQLMPGLHSKLESHFGCPVLDVYSSMESGPLATRRSGEESFRILPPDVHVEILRPDRPEPVAPGERGEITFTGGRNPFLPLVRYRTGDFATWDPEAPARFHSLDGRAPVIFASADGTRINNIDVTHALQNFPFAQFSLTQKADASLLLQTRGSLCSPEEAIEALRDVFGTSQQIEHQPLPANHQGEKFIQYRSELAIG